MVIVLFFSGPTGAAERLGHNLTLPGQKDFILQIDTGDRWGDLAVHGAITGAFRRLASPECQEIFSDFKDGNGRPLREKLQAIDQSAPDYLGLLRYTNGSRRHSCTRGGILASTTTGGRIVYICRRFTDKFLTMRLEERADLEVALIHEVLHTLGLGENPPTSLAITKQVLHRCGDE